jgi:hypothetical protein
MFCWLLSILATSVGERCGCGVSEAVGRQRGASGEGEVTLGWRTGATGAEAATRFGSRPN